ncbi:hypothetical protein [Trinickia sp. EG282A]|uniref:hypothetical protein n=1 Tax=Trinickia sp. EG282A TaxID=3237013 RepID=UPI0034D1E571
MAKPTNDQRADSTLDALTAAQAAPGDALGAIAAEELAENEALAARVEADAQAQADAEHALLVVGWQKAMRQAAGIVTAWFKDLKPIWTDEQMDGIGAALADCDAYYGWGGAGRLMGHPLVTLGVAAAPVAVGTYAWVQERKAKLAAERAAHAHAIADARTVATMPHALPAGEQKAVPPKQTGPAPNIGAAMDATLARDTVTT